MDCIESMSVEITIAKTEQTGTISILEHHEWNGQDPAILMDRIAELAIAQAKAALLALMNTEN